MTNLLVRNTLAKTRAQVARVSSEGATSLKEHSNLVEFAVQSSAASTSSDLSGPFLGALRRLTSLRLRPSWNLDHPKPSENVDMAADAFLPPILPTCIKGKTSDTALVQERASKRSWTRKGGSIVNPLETRQRWAHYVQQLQLSLIERETSLNKASLFLAPLPLRSLIGKDNKETWLKNCTWLMRAAVPEEKKRRHMSLKYLNLETAQRPLFTHTYSEFDSLCVCVRACARLCVCVLVYMRACVHACVRALVRVCLCERAWAFYVGG